MRRYLVVANQTLLGDPLLGRLTECLAAGPPFEEVILSTPSRWLRQDLPHRISRAFGLPVSTVVAARAAA